MQNVLSFVIILSVLILVHELGHFLVARLFKIKIEEFGLGYPPKIFGKKIGETIYSLNLLPFGGFVRMMGEDPTSLKELRGAGSDYKRAFYKQKKRVRIMVLMAGVVMNFLLGIVLFAAIYTKIGIPEQADYLLVTAITKDSPADKAGIKAEDKIIGIEGWQKPERTELVNSFVEFINQHQGEEIKIYLQDNREVRVKPRVKAEIPEGEGSLGVGITNMDLVMYPVWQRPFRGMVVGVKEAIGWGREIVLSLGKTLWELAKGKAPKDVAGPVGIYEISKGVVQEGWLAIFQFVAILSINLSILNLLPLPALDGGRLFFVGIETIRRKRIKPETEQLIHLIGIALLLGLMVLITINDVRRFLG